MKEPSETASAGAFASGDAASDLLEQYGCGPIRFSGHGDALYERHLLFDDVVDPLAAGARERFEAAARSVRDVLSQRWVRTERTYNRLNPKRIYYLSMEFLIGRSLANNVTNMLIDSFVHRATRERDLDWLGLLEYGMFRQSIEDGWQRENPDNWLRQVL
jgi:glycogen phosphorylase